MRNASPAVSTAACLVVTALAIACSSGPIARPGAGSGSSGITSIGRWQEEGRTGRYRVLVQRFCSKEECFSKAFLQWIRGIPGGDGFSVVRSVPIKEVNESRVFIRSFRAIQEPGRDSVFELVLSRTVMDLEERVMRIQPRPGATYEAEFDAPRPRQPGG